jgi:hypothetical protein
MANIEMCEMTVVYHCVALYTVVALCIVSILQVKDLGLRASLCWKLQSPALVCCPRTDDSGCRLPTVAVAITTMQKRSWLLLSRKHSSSSSSGGKLEALFQYRWSGLQQSENGTGSIIVGDRGKLCDDRMRDLEYHAGCMLSLLLPLQRWWWWSQEQSVTVQLLIAYQTALDTGVGCVSAARGKEM